MDESAVYAAGYQSLAKVFADVTASLPNAALPANPDLAAACKEELEQATEPLTRSATTAEIEKAGAVTVKQVDEICRSNRSALEERDAAIRDVVLAVSTAVNSLKNQGERHSSSLTRAADAFDALSRINDVNELRRELSQQVGRLRESVEQIRRESQEPAVRLEAQITSFRQRVEAARKGTSVDRLTGLGSRREAEKQLQKVLRAGRPDCVLVFDIEGFRAINERYGTIFGDKLLQAFAHSLRTRFPDQGTLFRWGADEFLAIAAGPLPQRADECRSLCESFTAGRYTSFDGGIRHSISALIAHGCVELRKGEGADEVYRRARQSLEENRAGLLK